MFGWLKERIEVPSNWFTRRMVRSMGVVQFLLVIIPIIKKGTYVPKIAKAILTDLHIFFFGLAWVLSLVSANLKLKGNSSVPSHDAKLLGEEEIKTTQKEMELLDEQLCDVLVAKQPLLEKKEELQRKLKTSRQERNHLQRKLEASERQEAFISLMEEELES